MNEAKNRVLQDDAEKHGWILTARGHKVYPLAAETRQIHLEDIAHALSMQNRWNGHTRWPFSVAQHSVMTSLNVVNYPREALLHDATEAYVSDVPRPVKQQMPEFQDHEERLMKVIMRRFKLEYPLPQEVHDIDRDMLIVEARDLFYPERATMIFGERARRVVAGYPRLEPWDQLKSKRLFLQRAQELGIK